MVNEEAISETNISLQSQKTEISKLAIMSLMFGILGPFSCGAMWIMSCNDFFTIGTPIIIVPFSCGLTWILGLVLGIKSLKQIESSEGQSGGREYAIAGISISAAWLLLIFVVLFLPMIYSVNS